MHKTHLGYGFRGNRGRFARIGGRPGHAHYVKKIWKNGAGGRNRTGTLSPELDFESSASTSSATPAGSRDFDSASLTRRDSLTASNAPYLP
jgi:hypothetical protein